MKRRTILAGLAVAVFACTGLSATAEAAGPAPTPSGTVTQDAAAPQTALACNETTWELVYGGTLDVPHVVSSSRSPAWHVWTTALINGHCYGANLYYLNNGELFCSTWVDGNQTANYATNAFIQPQGLPAQLRWQDDGNTVIFDKGGTWHWRAHDSGVSNQRPWYLMRLQHTCYLENWYSTGGGTARWDGRQMTRQ